ncbi:MAG: cupredoxin domain-containing protein [Candidatus Levybacteria bacterium]|nr:cupredoxin domain-containing protein [Candidatus Levybacteria bacterium]
MNKNLILGLIIVAAVVIAGAFLIKSSPSTQNAPSSTQAEPTAVITGSVTEKEATDSAMSGEVKEITVVGSPFKFDLKTITVKKGQKVKILFKNAQGNHDFVIDEFDVKTQVLNAGEEEAVEFTADQAGTFKYYCSVGNHRAMGMEGTLTVEE